MADGAKPAEKSADKQVRSQFSVSLPNSLGAEIDAVGKRIAEVVARETGAEPDISRAQVVQSLLRAALAAQSGKGNSGS